MRRAPTVVLSPTERRQLESWAGTGPAGGRYAVRARIVLAAAQGLPNAVIAGRLRVPTETASRWRSRFVLNGLDGLSRGVPRRGASPRVPRATVRRIVRATLASTPPTGGRWTTRSLARSLRVSHMLVHRVWSAHGLAPGRRPAPDGPPVQPRVDLGGAFVARDAGAVVFTVDERPGPPAVPRALPELVPNPTTSAEFSGPGTHAQELVRAVGTVEADRQRSGRLPEGRTALLVFLRGVERSVRRPLRLEVVFDRSLARLGRGVARWLASHPRFRVFTTTREQRWSEAVDAWLRRWEPGGLDRESLGTAEEFAREFPVDRFPGPAARPGPSRLSWRPTLGPLALPNGPAAGSVPLPAAPASGARRRPKARADRRTPARGMPGYRPAPV